MLTCRKCNTPIKPDQWRFGGPEGGWEHMAGDCPPTVHTIDAHTGEEHDDVLRTASGKVITEADIERWADEAEYGDPPTH